MTIREALLEAATQIAGEHARRDAETLLAHTLGCDRAWLLAHGDDAISPEHRNEFRALAARRAAHEPLQHLTGEQEFFGLTLRVTPDTLIPRPETELLVEAVLDFAKKFGRDLRILDIGTGTGAIALALAANLPDAHFTAVDISSEALAIARENAARHHLESRIKFAESDLLAALAGETFDVIVSNPPYVSLADAGTIAPEIRDHEPHLALFGRPEQNQDGLGVYRLLIPQMHAALVPGGLLALEIGFGQSEAVRGLFDAAQWRNIRILDDYAGIPRVVLGLRR